MAKISKKENQRRRKRKLKNKLCKTIRTGIYRSFKNGRGGLWESRVGYKLAELREHLQKQFEPGMSWANYGTNDGQWHIDHIKPVSFFDFNSYGDEDFKCYWSLSNLRPLWAKKGSYTLPKYRLSNNIRTGIYKSFRTGRGGRWESRVGYKLDELREHLQSQFTEGMSWSNYGQWHIDHIKTIASLNFSSYDDEDFKKCWALSNLRPLWARDNWTRKKNSLPLRNCLDKFFDESIYTFCLDCPQTVHIKYRGRFCFCKNFFRKFYYLKVPVGYSLPDLKWWETSDEKSKAMMSDALLYAISALQRQARTVDKKRHDKKHGERIKP